MFAARYFAPRYYAPRYWCKFGATIQQTALRMLSMLGVGL